MLTEYAMATTYEYSRMRKKEKSLYAFPTVWSGQVGDQHGPSEPGCCGSTGPIRVGAPPCFLAAISS
jgi:hypothetical protein